MDGSAVLLVALSNGWTELSYELVHAYGYRVVVAKSYDEALALLAGLPIALAVCEDSAPGHDGCRFLARVRTSHPDVVRIVAVAGHGIGDQLARAAVYQFLHLPLDVTQAGLVVERALEARELSRRHRVISREFKLSDRVASEVPAVAPDQRQRMRFEKLVYVSDKMAAVCHQAQVAARTDLPVLIQGETGTGKELLARAIHYHSPRRPSPLLVQNCGGVPDSLLQSELFGHKRGAFTGAVSDRLGLFRAANGGTVFLDEISEVSPSFQVSLLRFLQEHEIKPLGSDQVVTSNVRVLAASNRSLKAMVAAGEFRRDLYYRLAGFEIEVPPLRLRPADIAPLAELFTAKHAAETHRRILGVSPRVIEKLVAYSWPGNIRELENEIRRLVAQTADGEHVTTQHVSQTLLDGHPREPAGAAGGGAGRTLKDRVEDLERHLVTETLDRCRWNQSRAADELGLSRVGLANKIRRYQLAAR